MSDEGLLRWQWRLYPDNHRDPGNLAIHLATWPLFVAGLVAILAAAPTGALWLLGAGPVAMVLAIALQGRGHRREAVRPQPFRGVGDVVKRILAEQLVTFPRYVLSGVMRRQRQASASTARGVEPGPPS